jgi:hypothetical protein
MQMMDAYYHEAVLRQKAPQRSFYKHKQIKVDDTK